MTGQALTIAAVLALALCGCGERTTATGPGDGQPTPSGVPAEEIYDGIRAEETLRFTGTEPFWGGEASGGTLTYITPEDPDGTVIEIERFAGRGGISFSGLLEGQSFDMTATPLPCSDGMSDRTYPFTVTLKLGEENRNGCGWTERQPFDGPEAP